MSKTTAKDIAEYFHNKNFEFMVRVEEERYDDGDEYRCYSIIENAWISDASNVVKIVMEDLSFDDEIDKYCCERILNLSGLDNVNSYDISKFNGYYGEEIDNVFFKGEKELSDNIQNLLKLKTDYEKIKFVLEFEYGFLLDKLGGKNVAIREVVFKDLYISNNSYMGKLNRNKVKQYKQHYKDYPIGIYEDVGSKYKLIDGYHRYMATKQDNIKKCKIIYLY